MSLMTMLPAGNNAFLKNSAIITGFQDLFEKVQGTKYRLPVQTF